MVARLLLVSNRARPRPSRGPSINNKRRGLAAAVGDTGAICDASGKEGGSVAVTGPVLYPDEFARGGREAYSRNMSAVQDIEAAVQRLSPEDLASFREWFAEFDAALWDAQLEADIKAGKLDRLAAEALQDLREGRCTDL